MYPLDEGSTVHYFTLTKVLKKANFKNSGKVKCECPCGYTETKKVAKIKSVNLSKTTLTYNGNKRKPAVKVKDADGNILKRGTDYTVEYSKGRKEVGTYTVTVTFKGNYSGTKKLTFKIIPKGTNVSKLTAGSKKITVKWKKQTVQTNGYEIRYSTSKKMKNAQTVTATKNATTSKTVKNLKSGKTYFVQVRTYKTVDGKKIYSPWSSVKTVKTK